MKKNFNANLVGMTMMETIVAIVIITVLTTVTLVAMTNVRKQSRDSQRVSDITQLQVALSAYHRDTGLYPVAITGGQQLKATNTVYIVKVPVPPAPLDGICDNYPVYTSYYYEPGLGLKSYNLHFCLGAKTGDIDSGSNKAMPTGIVTSEVPVPGEVVY